MATIVKFTRSTSAPLAPNSDEEESLFVTDSIEMEEVYTVWNALLSLWSLRCVVYLLKYVPDMLLSGGNRHTESIISLHHIPELADKVSIDLNRG